MDFVSPLATYDPALVVAATLIMLLAGFVKGAIGFALPMIAISGLGSFLSAQEAIAILILPTFLSNFWQSFRQGGNAAGGTMMKFWKLNLLMALTILVVAQFVPDISSDALFVLLGTTVAVTAGLQLSGWRPRVSTVPSRRAAVEVVTGIIAGVIGGMSGVWGPPVIFLLIALDTPKTEMVRTQGVTYVIGSLMLVSAHLQSGLLDGRTLPMSLLMCLPSMLGMRIGLRALDRMDQQLFRRLTLIVLCLAGLNLLRRGLL